MRIYVTKLINEYVEGLYNHRKHNTTNGMDVHSTSNVIWEKYGVTKSYETRRTDFLFYHSSVTV